MNSIDKEDDVEFFKKLKDLGGNVSYKDQFDRNFLYMACVKRAKNIAEYLIEHHKYFKIDLDAHSNVSF